MCYRFDSGKDGYIDLMELKMMMEKLGAPQTHIGLKNMIREVDEDYDGKLSYREVGCVCVWVGGRVVVCGVCGGWGMFFDTTPFFFFFVFLSYIYVLCFASEK